MKSPLILLALLFVSLPAKAEESFCMIQSSVGGGGIFPHISMNGEVVESAPFDGDASILVPTLRKMAEAKICTALMPPCTISGKYVWIGTGYPPDRQVTNFDIISSHDTIGQAIAHRQKLIDAGVCYATNTKPDDPNNPLDVLRPFPGGTKPPEKDDPKAKKVPAPAPRPETDSESQPDNNSAAAI